MSERGIDLLDADWKMIHDILKQTMSQPQRTLLQDSQICAIILAENNIEDYCGIFDDDVFTIIEDCFKYYNAEPLLENINEENIKSRLFSSFNLTLRERVSAFKSSIAELLSRKHDYILWREALENTDAIKNKLETLSQKELNKLYDLILIKHVAYLQDNTSHTCEFACLEIGDMLGDDFCDFLGEDGFDIMLTYLETDLDNILARVEYYSTDNQLSFNF